MTTSLPLRSVREPLYEPADLRRLLGHYPTGVSVVTAHAAEEGPPLALVIGSLTSVSLEPPLVGFLPMRTSRTWQQMATVGRFCINVLGSDQERICRAMAQSSRRFEDVAIGQSAGGLPMLEDAILHIECTQHAVLEAGDHWFVLGAVDRIAAPREQAPLIFHRGAYGSFSPL